jgi:hypothetical protein
MFHLPYSNYFIYLMGILRKSKKLSLFVSGSQQIESTLVKMRI